MSKRTKSSPRRRAETEAQADAAQYARHLLNILGKLQVAATTISMTNHPNPNPLDFGQIRRHGASCLLEHCVEQLTRLHQIVVDNARTIGGAR